MNPKISIQFDYIAGKSRNKKSDISNLKLVSGVNIYNYEQKATFFCLSSEKRDDVKSLTYAINEYLNEPYLCIYLNTVPTLSLCICINRKWMQSNLPAPEAVNDFSLRSIFREFAQSHSVVASRHILFLEQLSMSEFKEILIQSYAAQFIHSLLVQLNLEFKSDNNTQFKDSDVKKVIEIEQRVISNFPKVSPTIKEMSDMAGMSTSEFKIIFFEVFKESPHQHILNKKLLFAKELLQTGQYSIAQVSYKVGFNHPSGFTRLFKTKFKFPPSTVYKVSVGAGKREIA